MKIKRFLAFSVAVISVISLLLAFSACKNESEPTTGGDVNYSVTVTDGAGAPVKDIVVRIYESGEQVKMSLTGDEGKVSVSLPAGDYTVALSSPFGKAFYYDSDACVLTADAPLLNVTIYDTIDTSAASENLYFAFDKDSMTAPVVTDGGYRVPLSAGENYFIFMPTVRGRYEFKVTADASFTLEYNGAPSYVQNVNLAGDEAADSTVFMTDPSSIFFDIRAFHIGDSYGSTSKFVVSITAEANTTASITVGKVSDIPLSPQELPWEEKGLNANPSKYTVPYSDCDNVILTDFNIADPNLTVVYNDADGFYHLGTADGPLVYVRLTSASQYLGAFQNVCENTLFGGYIYNEDGSFKSKVSYHTMMLKYIEAADETYGVYPLDNNLKEAIITFGEIQGWWRAGSMNYIFSDLGASLVTENAWLFAAAYVDGFTKGSVTEPLEITTTGKLALGEGDEIYIAVPSGAVASYSVTFDALGDFTVLIDGSSTSDEGVITVSSGSYLLIRYSGEGVGVFEYTAATVAPGTSSEMYVDNLVPTKIYVIASGSFVFRAETADVTLSVSGDATYTDGDGYVECTVTVSAPTVVEITVTDGALYSQIVDYTVTPVTE